MKKRSIILISILLLCLLFLASLAFGRFNVPLGEVVRILVDRITPLEQTWADTMETAVLNIRLPRIILAIMVGCSLSAAGAAYQGVFQNPMASPDLLGASSGACFGAALAIVLDVPRDAFLPAPKVDSAVVHCVCRKTPIVDVDEAHFFRTVRGGFALRRKTLVNSLMNEFGSAFSKEELAAAIAECGFDANIRGERLTLHDYAALSNKLLSRKK